MGLIIVANWKMHKTNQETRDYIDKLKNLQGEFSTTQVVICPPFTALSTADEALLNTNISLGAQNMLWESEGAFTGEVSPLMLKDLGVRYVILGHSERRWIMGETDEQINKKINAAFDFNLIPVFCVGETAGDRNSGLTEKIILKQLNEGLKGLDSDKIKNLIIAYEPVWAIGTGTAASRDDAAGVTEMILKETGNSRIRILYGGSVNKENIGEFVSVPGISGALVGGASLQADTFAGLIRAARDARASQEV